MAEGGKRLTQRKADEVAEAVVNSFQTFGSIAVQKELDVVTEALKSKPGLLFAIRTVLNNQGLEKLLCDPPSLMTLGTLAQDGTLLQMLSEISQGKTAGSPGGTTRAAAGTKRSKLRVSCKRFKHLSCYMDLVVLPALLRINQDLSDDIGFADNVSPLDVLIFGLDTEMEQKLPYLYHEKGSFADELIDMFVVRHGQTNRLSNLTKQDLEAGSGGYYSVDGKKVKYNLEEDKVVTFEFADSVEVQSKWFFDASVICKVGGKGMKLDLKPSF